MIGMPCENPSCHSYGKPHPNCKCYASYAEGGDVSFCSQNRPHDPSCQYSQPEDPNHEASGYLANNGINGLLNGRLDSNPQKYHSSIKQGHKKIEDHSQSLFSGSFIPKPENSKFMQELDKWMNGGGIIGDIQNQQYSQNQPYSEQTPQMFAQGGEANSSQSQSIASLHPAQNLLLQTAKGRISQYLNSQKPQPNLPKLAFDSEPDQTRQEKIYQNAKEIAINPLSILHEIKQGTIEPEHVKHFNSMYPELNDSLQKKLTENISKAQLNDEKPPHSIRQGLSLFMGTPLNSELAPQGIQAAQAVFQNQQAQQPQPSPPAKGRNKKNTSTLSKSSQSFLTGSQASTARLQKQ